MQITLEHGNDLSSSGRAAPRSSARSRAVAAARRPIEAMESRVLMSGTVVDDFQMASNKNAASHEIVEDATGNLFVASGAIDAAGGHHALVRQGRRQTDGSVSWSATPVIDYSLAPSSTLSGPKSSFKDLVIDPANGDLYAAGQALDPAGGTDWVVVKRSAADGTVRVVDDYRYADGKSAYATGITLDAAGNVFVAGVASGRWIVRELKASGSAFQTVQDFVYAKASTNVEDVVAAPSGIYVCGFGSGYWLTQRGVADAAGNLSWTTVESYRADPNFSSSARGVGVDGAGNVYTLGTARKSTGVKVKGQTVSTSEWTVRRTSDAGASWATLDSLTLSSNTSLAHTADDFGTDPAGNLYVAGYAPGADNVNHAVVRTAKPDGTGWATLDDWQLAAGQSAFASGFLADSRGALYTAGNAADSGSIRHAIVRRIDPPAGVSTTLSSSATTDSTSTEEEGSTSLVELVGI